MLYTGRDSITAIALGVIIKGGINGKKDFFG